MEGENQPLSQPDLVVGVGSMFFSLQTKKTLSEFD